MANFFDQFDAPQQGANFFDQFDRPAGPAPATAADEQPKKFGLGDTWPAKLAKSIYSAVTLPGDVYQGNVSVTDDSGHTNPEVINRAAELAPLASPVAPGSVAFSRAAPIPNIAKAAEDLKGAGADVYNSVAGVAVPPAHPPALSRYIEQYLTGPKAFRDHPESAEATLQEIRRLAESRNIGDLRSSRMALGRYAQKVDEKGSPTPNAAAAQEAMGYIDDYLSSLAPELKAANANYSAGSSLDRLNFRQQQADRRAGKTGAGSNIENTMRQEVDRISNRGLSEYEQALKDQIVKGDATRNMLRKVGKLGFGDGLSMQVHGALALPTLGAYPLFVGGGATAMRKIGEGLTKNDIQELARAIAARAPLYKTAPDVSAALPMPIVRGIAGGQMAPLQVLGRSVVPVRADDEY